jgi:hypothetical protein
MISSTIYIGQLIFCFQNEQNSVRLIFDAANKIIFWYTNFVHFENKIKEELRIEIRTLCVLQKAKQNYRQIDFDRAV